MSETGLPNVHVALVLNGGVSLAVWMSGVVHELDRVRSCMRRHEGSADPGDDDEQASSAWREVCKAAKLGIKIDLISGTSAGGLNGALLANSVAAGRQLPDLQTLWRDSARLDDSALLSWSEEGPRTTVLNGNWFEEQIRTKLGEQPESVGEPQDVTLLVTSSALGSSAAAVVDAAGRPFSAGDHRRVFRFCRASGTHTLDVHGPTFSAEKTTDDFAAPVRDELARAARASAGFPVAFEPVWEGALNARNIADNTGGPSWLVDGGVLDNTPFGPIVNELKGITRSEPGDRWIVYIVPTAGGAVEAPPGAHPPPWEKLPGKLVGLWRESDGRDDVESLKEHWQASNAAAHRPEELIGESIDGDELERVGNALFRLYRRTKARQLVHQFAAQSGNERLKYQPQTAAEETLLADGAYCWIPSTRASTRPMAGVDSWQWGIGAALRMSSWIRRQARDDPRDPSLRLAGEAARVESRLGAIATALEALESTALSEDGISSAIDVSNRAYVGSGLLEMVATEMSGLVSKWARHRSEEASLAWSRLVHAEVVTNTASWQTGEVPQPFALYIVSPDSDLRGSSLDPCKNASLLDSGRWPANKLYGTRFGHFGAFGKAEWRDWDWKWGRIDGAVTLARALLDAGHVPLDEQKRLLAALVDEILNGEEPDELLAKSVEVSQLEPGQLIARAHNSQETDFDAVVEILSGLVERSSLVQLPQGRTWVGRRATGAWRRTARLMLKVGRWAARRAVRHQSP